MMASPGVACDPEGRIFTVDTRTQIRIKQISEGLAIPAFHMEL